MSAPESALARALLWFSVGVTAGFPALFLPGPDDPRLTVVIHLVVLGVFSITLAFHLAPLADIPWFAGRDLGMAGRRAVTWAAEGALVVAATVGAAVATAAALRYDVSMQYLVVLAATSVAAPTALAVLGVRRRRGPVVGAAAGAVIAVILIWAMWRYMEQAGVGPNGSWIVDGSRFGTVVLPWMALCWAGAVAAFTTGTRGS